MEKRVVQKIDGEYMVNIDITVDEWKSLLRDATVFDSSSKKMMEQWYYEPNHQAAAKKIMKKYCPECKRTPYNGIVKGLSIRIIKKLNRFWVVGTKGEKSYWCFPFEGWHDNKSSHFIWKIRQNLVTALEELKLVNPIEKYDEDQFLETYVCDKEGQRVLIYGIKYERSRINRQAAIRIAIKKRGHLTCEVCGFDFEKTYGEIGKNFIEVHHNKPLFLLDGETKVNPETDLSCVCPNCHRMLHSRKGVMLSVDDLKKIISDKTFLVLRKE